ncbi:dihydroxyacetone kinase phosphoryl donor subunit DhaM [Oceanobacillus sp. 1P07AA]|uniref:dihydroxyacetone kinase phosphoryl donor subunit DhaM n=1 Tax=Oceanobacillus sp. 1P07AA TaxID=3132293 RepID=UPI0039A7184A
MGQVGIVLISHSAKIADGTKELVQQVMKDVSIEVAGGTDEGEIGTSIDKILSAINKVNNDNGVLLLYDIGSAKMNAEMAIEMTEVDDVEIIEAPIVEGAYVAAVEAGMGKEKQEIIEAVTQSFSKQRD